MTQQQEHQPPRLLLEESGSSCRGLLPRSRLPAPSRLASHRPLSCGCGLARAPFTLSLQMFPRLFSSRLPFSTMRRAKHCLLGPRAFFPFPVSLFSGPDMCGPGLLLRCPVGSHVASEKAKLEGKEFTMRTQPAYPCHFLSEKQKTPGCTFSSQSSARIYGGPATL